MGSNCVELFWCDLQEFINFEYGLKLGPRSPRGRCMLRRSLNLMTNLGVGGGGGKVNHGPQLSPLGL